MKPDFNVKLHNAQQARGSDLALLLAPHLTRMPLLIQRYDDPFLPFGRAIISATRDLVCAYVFDLAAYLALGAAGAVALERTIAAVDEEIVTILHGAFVGSAYVEAADAFHVDAVTLADLSDADAYHTAGLGTFVLSESGDSLSSTNGLHLRLIGERVLYAGRGDDFAEQGRAALQKVWHARRA